VQLGFACEKPKERGTITLVGIAEFGKGGPDVDTINERMVKLLTELTIGEGMRPTVIDGVDLMRTDRYTPLTPVLYEPSVVVVAQGRKTGYVGERVYRYDPNNYLVLTVPLPFECEIEATPDYPMLGVSIRADLSILSELMMSMDRPLPPGAPTPMGICATPLDRPLGEAVVRLLEHLTRPEAAHILGPQTVREITYHVLCGDQGTALQAALTMHGHFSQISRALHRIHAEYAQPLEVKALADEAHMSLSVFHRRFKGITSTPPLQYLKAVRLHKARMLMVQDRVNAGEAAHQVGYESASQFSREFKRLFGRSPSEEAAQVRQTLSKPLAAQAK